MHLHPGRTAEDGDGSVVALVHERAEHGAGRCTVRVADDGDLLWGEEGLLREVHGERADVLSQRQLASAFTTMSEEAYCEALRLGELLPVDGPRRARLHEVVRQGHLGVIQERP